MGLFKLYDFSYNPGMSLKFTAALFQQNWMKVVRILFISSSERCLRELVDLSGMSPGGVQDVVRRLESEGLVSARRYKNKVFYSLNLADEERELLGALIGLETKRELQSRRELFSSRRTAAIEWIDETLSAIVASRESFPRRALSDAT